MTKKKIIQNVREHQENDVDQKEEKEHSHVRGHTEKQGAVEYEEVRDK